jgi:LEA14-like dessication related protein
MRTRVERVLAALRLVLVLLLVGCGHVERPRFVPQHAEWLGGDAHGLALRVTLAAYNPNPFELPLRDLRATVTLANAPRAEAEVTNLTVVLPPQREIPVTADLIVPWHSIPHVASAFMGASELPYQVDGTITAEHHFTVTSHFTHTGVLSRDVIAQRASERLHGFFHGLHERYGGSEPSGTTEDTPAQPGP